MSGPDLREFVLLLAAMDDELMRLSREKNSKASRESGRTNGAKKPTARVETA